MQARKPSDRRGALAGFLISGMLMSFPGAVLPAWGYHLTEHFRTAGNYFLCMDVGILLSVRFSAWLLKRRGPASALVIGAALASAALLSLAFLRTPAARLASLAVIGAGAGILNAGVFQAVSTAYVREPSGTVNRGGVFFGMGCVATALLIAGTFYVYDVPSILILFAAVPGFFAVWFARAPMAPQLHAPREAHSAWQDFKNPTAILFAVLLFFQFASEWSIAGWLPLFLTRRFGMSPEGALLLLALYWLCLTLGRLGAQLLLKRTSQARLLLWSMIGAVLGCTILAFTESRFSAGLAIVFLGCSFASIYPIVVGLIGKRFPYYHPGLYNGILSFALTGGLLAPWLLGFIAEAWGIRAVMIVPLLCTCMVLLAVGLIAAELRLSGTGKVRRAGA